MGTPHREQMDAESIALAMYSELVYSDGDAYAKPACSIPIARVL